MCVVCVVCVSCVWYVCCVCGKCVVCVCYIVLSEPLLCILQGSKKKLPVGPISSSSGSSISSGSGGGGGGGGRATSDQTYAQLNESTKKQASVYDSVVSEVSWRRMQVEVCVCVCVCVLFSTTPTPSTHVPMWWCIYFLLYEIVRCVHFPSRVTDCPCTRIQPIIRKDCTSPSSRRRPHPLSRRPSMLPSILAPGRQWPHPSSPHASLRPVRMDPRVSTWN